jgi:hypothetical protein
MVTVLVVSLAILALVSFVVLVAALRAGSSDPGFEAGSTKSEPVDDDDEHRAA